jgi:hypothetical protein
MRFLSLGTTIFSASAAEGRRVVAEEISFAWAMNASHEGPVAPESPGR